MKVNKIMSIDVELMEKLQEEDNASKLVNDLLVEHYQSVRPTGQSDKDRKKYLINEIAKDKLKEKHKKELEKLNG